MNNYNISIVIPFFNEESNIPSLIDQLSQFTAKNNSLNIEFIFVDDGSVDQSFDKILSYKKNFNYKLIRLSKNFGAHAALRVGILHSNGDFVSFVYADLQDPLEIILEMYQKCISGKKNICWATRNNFTTSFFQRTFSKFYAYLIKKFVSNDFPENGFDVLIFDSKIRKILNSNIENNSSLFLQILTLGFQTDSISYERVERKFGKSKWTFSKKIKLLIDTFVSFSYAPIRFVTIAGVLLLLIGIITSSYIILRRLFWHDLQSGWAMLISIVIMGFGVSNISLGIIAEYLWRTLDVARKRPVFIIDQIIHSHDEK